MRRRPTAAPAGSVAMGPSTSALLGWLGTDIGRGLHSGDEIVVAEAGHEANIGPWVAAAEASGARLLWWRVGPKGARRKAAAFRRISATCSLLRALDPARACSWGHAAGETAPLEALEALLGPRTRLVAFPHVSNLLGEVVDVAAACQLCRSAGAISVVDGMCPRHSCLRSPAPGLDATKLTARIFPAARRPLLRRSESLSIASPPVRRRCLVCAAPQHRRSELGRRFLRLLVLQSLRPAPRCAVRPPGGVGAAAGAKPLLRSQHGASQMGAGRVEPRGLRRLGGAAAVHRPPRRLCCDAAQCGGRGSAATTAEPARHGGCGVRRDGAGGAAASCRAAALPALQAECAVSSSYLTPLGWRLS